MVDTNHIFKNPVLAGFYPDPSVCRAGSDYYLVTSSFAYYPGLPLFHSCDLVSWKQIGAALNRPEQLNLDGIGISRGLFAPTIRFHNGIFFITCTLVDGGENFVINSKDPAGDWSNPFWLPEVDGIDPSLFFDDDDKAYLVYNSIPPGNVPLYEGHRTIRFYEFDYDKMKVCGDQKILINGGVDISKKPIWIEAPHIYKKDGWYFLLCAEGGTGYDHSEVAFRSRAVAGPYVPYERNPVLTQRHLDPERKNPVTTAGHADLVETPGGKWYAVFLACRPYKDNHFNIGRETFLAPVRWTKDKWPVITEVNESIQYCYSLPVPDIQKAPNFYSGNFTFRDDFSTIVLNQRWMFLRTVRESWYSLSGDKRGITMNLRPETVAGSRNPSFIGHRQQHIKCTATTSMLFNATNENEKAGLVILQNEEHYYYLCKSVENEKQVIQLFQSGPQETLLLLASTFINTPATEVQFKIKTNSIYYDFYYAVDGSHWTALKKDVDGTFLSTETAGGFVGCVFGLYATSLGKNNFNKAVFNWFEYTGDDEILK